MADYSKGRSEEELEPFFPNEILRHTLSNVFLYKCYHARGIVFSGIIPEING